MYRPLSNRVGEAMAYGYRYDAGSLQRTGSVHRKKDEFSLSGLLKEAAIGGVMGGLAGTAFYGAGKALGFLKDSVRDVRGKGSSRAEVITQYEKLKSRYAANEIINAERIGSGLKADLYHRSASYIFEEQLEQGRTFTFTNGDGRKMTLLQTEGGLNGVAGIYEYILNPKGQVEHQMFKPGAGMIGPK